MRKYELVEVQELEMRKAPVIEDHYLMSPFVWRDGDRFFMALRVVEPTANGGWGSSRILFASGDGVTFELLDDTVLNPGPWAEDLGGCEDPTVFFHEGECRVYYTGWNAHIRQAKLLYASGPDIGHLEKRGDVMPVSRHWNTKEATLVWAREKWRLFFEYSDLEHSLIGRAWSRAPGQEWHPEPPPFGLREGHWDSFHLSTGPVALTGTDTPVMFYNGADDGPKWRVGWIEFDPTFSTVLRRCEEPLVSPEHLPTGFSDIAFAASAIALESGHIEVYISVGDRTLHKAIVEVSG